MCRFIKFFNLLSAVCAAISLASASWAADDAISTVAGGGPSGLPDVNANLNQPYGVAVDAAGNVYFASAAQNRIYKIASTGKLTVIAGTGVAGFSGDGAAATSALLNYPVGVAVDGANPANVFVSDNRNCLVRKINGANGTIMTIAGLVTKPATGLPYATCGFNGDGIQAKSAELNSPNHIAIDPRNGDLYIADFANGRVRKVAGGVSTGAISTVAGGGGSTTAANNCAGGVPYGDGSAATASYLCNPRAVALDTAVTPANVFIAENGRCVVREVVGANKNIYTVAGTTNGCGFVDGVTATSGRFADLYQLHVTVSGTTTTVTAADYANGRIRSFPLTYSANVPKPGTLSTIAGKGQGFCGDGGAALSACFGPTGLAYDASGNYYIGDYYNARIRKVAHGTTTVSSIAGWGNSNYSSPVNLGTVPATGLALWYPAGIFADPNSTKLYIGGYSSYSVYAFDSSSGNATTVAGNGTAGFAGDGEPGNGSATELNLPEQVAKDTAGNVYIADVSNCAIRKVAASNGYITTVAGGSPSHLNGCGYAGDSGLAANARLSSPRGLAVFNNNLYVADTSNCVVRKISLSSNTISTVAGSGTCGFRGDGGPATSAQLNQPVAVSFDSAGSMYIADQYNHRIRVVDPYFGDILTIAGTGAAGYTGDGDAVGVSLLYPAGVASDPNGNLFISDSNNHIVRWIDPAGQIVTIAGTPQSAGFSGDGGVATEATLYYPQQTSVDAAENVYVADYYNHRIRKISAFAGFGRSTDRLIFSKQQVGTKSGTQVITLSAIGATTISSLSVPSGFSELDDCVGNTLAAGDNCEIDVTFNPTKVGVTDGKLTINSNALFPQQSKVVELVGEGGGLSLAGSTTFANQLDGASHTNTMTLTNTGTSAIGIKAYAFQNTMSFKVTGGTCPQKGATLAAGASCTILATFNASTTGTHNGTLAVISTVASSSLLTTFSGVSTTVTPTPTSLSVGSVATGKTSVLKVTVKNATGPFSLKPVSSSTAFTVLAAGNTCTSALASGASCTLPVQFAPTAAASYTGSLTLVSGVSNSPVVSLTGAGTK